MRNLTRNVALTSRFFSGTFRPRVDSSGVASRWSDDAFLDGLRLQGDAAADACFAELVGLKQDFSRLFEFLNSDDAPIPDDAPPVLKAFVDECRRTPTPVGQPVDAGRLERGEDVFMTHACCCALVLLLKSLPAGYAAPNLAKILVMSGNLENHPYKRLLGVLQMVVNVTSRGGFEPDGKALITAPKLRLLHAGVRHLVRRHVPEYQAQYGTPVNHEDMLATIMGFSLLVVGGLRQLRVGLTDQQAEDYFYLWRIYALAMGIHPPGAPDSTEYLPADLTEAEELYRAYARRHFRNAAENLEGVELTRANLLMLDHLLARTHLRWCGLKLAPRIYMQQLLGAEGMVRRGVTPVAWHSIARQLFLCVPRVLTWLGALADKEGCRHYHERLSQIFFEGLIVRTMNGEVTFLIPDRLADLHRLTESVMRPYGERRRVQRRVQEPAAGIADRRTRPDRRLAFRQTFWGLGCQASAVSSDRAVLRSDVSKPSLNSR